MTKAMAVLGSNSSRGAADGGDAPAPAGTTCCIRSFAKSVATRSKTVSTTSRSGEQPGST